MKTVPIVRFGFSLMALAGIGSAWLSLQRLRQKRSRANLKHAYLQKQARIGYRAPDLSFSIRQDFIAKPEQTDFIENMAIVGVTSEYAVFDSEKEPDGRLASQEASIGLFYGTIQAIPMLVGFELGYVGDDHHIRNKYVNIQVNEIVNGVAAVQTDAMLNDSGGDKPWHGRVTARFLCLTPLPAGASGVLTIQGISNQLIDVGYQNDASQVVSQQITISVPRGTTRIIPFLVRFLLTFENDDHHLAFEHVYVDVASVDTINATATIEAQMCLADKDQNKPWSGYLNALLLFLGPVS